MNNEYTLRMWLDEKRGRLTRIAKGLNKHYTWVSQIANGQKKAPLDTAIKIAELTNNEVSIQAIARAYKSRSPKN
ncbi:hypothetical protein [Paralysiella testudinis]|uniref:Uncharacterized protein n=1 Tax=Paralysiella testudinis TaxID=2809020 RepID=A0A892ZI60_9NEIS|nr:hypothetical protein [Paralysiella testudinis]QRQ82881.1 hypothetical protein JQU52_05755 [Paralysiella testudinis]